MVTYLRQGNLAFDDGLGNRGASSAGEFRRITPGRDTRLVELNPSLTNIAQVFQICLRPSPDATEQSFEQCRFSVAERRGLARIIASPDGRAGSLRVTQDVQIYSGLLYRGQHIVHELPPGRALWIHVVTGRVSLGDVNLMSGEGAGVSDQPAASMTALASSEFLWVDVAGASADDGVDEASSAPDSITNPERSP